MKLAVNHPRGALIAMRRGEASLLERLGDPGDGLLEVSIKEGEVIHKTGLVKL